MVVCRVRRPQLAVNESQDARQLSVHCLMVILQTLAESTATDRCPESRPHLA